MKPILRSEFNYTLPDDRIAQKPLDTRSESKLLVYKNEISHLNFKDLFTCFDEPVQFIFNNTKVVPARLFFKRQTGAVIEVFLLDPEGLTIEEAMNQNRQVVFRAMIGGLKKWKDDEVLTSLSKDYPCTVSLIDRKAMVVQISWEQDISFADLIEGLGNVPLPPYIKREASKKDIQRYQTVYATRKGAVAAPTAGLHFTESMLEELEHLGHEKLDVTLHVGAGTFLPMTDDEVSSHKMHAEPFTVDRNTLKRLQSSSPKVAVGTTSLRSLESLYWVGYKLKHKMDNPYFIEQDCPIGKATKETNYKEAIQFVLDDIDGEEVHVNTAIMINRNVEVLSIKAIITNFHLPNSTLLVLVDALIGHEWKTVYEEALKNNYRFLSFGDSSLLFLE